MIRCPGRVQPSNADTAVLTSSRTTRTRPRLRNRHSFRKLPGPPRGSPRPPSPPPHPDAGSTRPRISGKGRRLALLKICPALHHVKRCDSLSEHPGKFAWGYEEGTWSQHTILAESPISDNSGHFRSIVSLRHLAYHLRRRWDYIRWKVQRPAPRKDFGEGRKFPKQ